MDESRRAAAYVTIGANVLLAVSGGLTGILLARALGPTGRGELAAIVVWPGILLTLGGLGVPHTIAYFVARRPLEAGRVYANALALGVIQCVVLAVCGFFLVPLVLRREFSAVIPLGLIYLLSMPISLTGGIEVGILQGLLWMKQHSIQRVVPAGIYLLGLLALFGSGRGSLSAVVAFLLLTQIVSVALGFWFIRDAVGNGFGLHRDLLREMLGYGLKTQAANSTQALNLRLDQLVMSIFLSPQNLGHYAVAATLSGAVIPLNNAVGILTLPDVASREADTQGQRVAAILRLTLLLTLPLSVLMIVTIPWLLPLVFGTGYVPATVAAQILVAGGIFLGINDILAEGLRGMNRPGVPALAEVFSLIITVLLLSVLLPRYGVTGAAISSAIASAVTSGIMAGHLVRRGSLRFGALLPSAADGRLLWRMAKRQTSRRSLASGVPGT